MGQLCSTRETRRRTKSEAFADTSREQQHSHEDLVRVPGHTPPPPTRAGTFPHLAGRFQQVSEGRVSRLRKSKEVWEKESGLLRHLDGARLGRNNREGQTRAAGAKVVHPGPPAILKGITVDIYKLEYGEPFDLSWFDGYLRELYLEDPSDTSCSPTQDDVLQGDEETLYPIDNSDVASPVISRDLIDDAILKGQKIDCADDFVELEAVEVSPDDAGSFSSDLDALVSLVEVGRRRFFEGDGLQQRSLDTHHRVRMSKEEDVSSRGSSSVSADHNDPETAKRATNSAVSDINTVTSHQRHAETLERGENDIHAEETDSTGRNLSTRPVCRPGRSTGDKRRDPPKPNVSDDCSGANDQALNRGRELLLARVRNEITSPRNGQDTGGARLGAVRCRRRPHPEVFTGMIQQEMRGEIVEYPGHLRTEHVEEAGPPSPASR
ncbi:hypothetical protein CTRI78_v001277 [Colletotrichum trifolii]|uniref:Uncharacterized protein n=1 Tax=Colletotrichum trifolii TaxID=5466 RepID=A0A4R8RZD6_COLTR|nr:hypothetical protein CTRI78_v001277 [Colletotrichum trifolii]